NAIAIVVGKARYQDGGIADIALLHQAGILELHAYHAVRLFLFRLLRLQQRAADRIAVEIRITPPHDFRIPVYQRIDARVADQSQVECFHYVSSRNPLTQWPSCGHAADGRSAHPARSGCRSDAADTIAPHSPAALPPGWKEYRGDAS